MKKREIVQIEWVDSYGAISGWQNLDDFKLDNLSVKTWGMIVREDEENIAIAQNYAFEGINTPEQANGIMVIPKASISKITPMLPV